MKSAIQKMCNIIITIIIIIYFPFILFIICSYIVVYETKHVQDSEMRI